VLVTLVAAKENCFKEQFKTVKIRKCTGLHSYYFDG